jgi:hypothetical protein
MTSKLNLQGILPLRVALAELLRVGTATYLLQQAKLLVDQANCNIAILTQAIKLFKVLPGTRPFVAGVSRPQFSFRAVDQQL